MSKFSEFLLFSLSPLHQLTCALDQPCDVGTCNFHFPGSERQA